MATSNQPAKKAEAKGIVPAKRGNPAYVPTEESHEIVEKLGKHCKAAVIANVLKISRSTFWKYHGDHYLEVWANRVSDIGEKMLEKADAGDTSAMKFVLERYGDWKPRQDVELTGPQGGPIRTVDMTQIYRGMSDEQLEQASEFFEKLAAAGVIDQPSSDSGSAEAA